MTQPTLISADRCGSADRAAGVGTTTQQGEVLVRVSAPLLDIVAFGLPISQGSHRALVNRHTGRAVVVESNNARLRPWREAVKQAALDATGPGWQPLGGPLRIEMTFTLPRPKSHYRTGRNAHLLRETAPLFPVTGADLDKLSRCKDALTDAAVWCDDKQVVEEHNRKVYVGSPDALGRPGARIRIWPAEAQREDRHGDTH